MPLISTFAGASARGLGFQAGAELGDYESIASQTLTGTQSTIDITSIPQTYKHLQIRFALIINNNGDMFCRLNGDTGNNYSWHILRGSGGAASSGAGSSTSSARIGTGWTAANVATVGLIDILDYADTNKYTTIRTFGGVATNTTTNWVEMNSANWRNTNGVTSVSIFQAGASFTQYSSIALYGIKG